MIKSGHGAMLEHGTIYLSIPELRDMNKTWNFYKNNKYSKTNTHQNIDDNGKTEPSVLKVTTNFRVLIESNRLDDLRYICEPTEYHEKRITAKFICDRGVSHELVRHRVFSLHKSLQDTVTIVKINLVMNLLLLFLVGLKRLKKQAMKYFYRPIQKNKLKKE